MLVDWELAAIGNRDLDVATASLESVAAAGPSLGLVPLTDRSRGAARLALRLIARIVGHSERAFDPDRLRADRLSLAAAGLR